MSASRPWPGCLHFQLFPLLGFSDEWPGAAAGLVRIVAIIRLAAAHVRQLTADCYMQDLRFFTGQIESHPLSRCCYRSSRYSIHRTEGWRMLTLWAGVRYRRAPIQQALLQCFASDTSPRDTHCRYPTSIGLAGLSPLSFPADMYETSTGSSAATRLGTWSRLYRPSAYSMLILSLPRVPCCQ